MTPGLAVALASAGLICICMAWLWRGIRTERAWERGLARPLVLDGIREAICLHRLRTGQWPARKADIRGRVRVEGKTLQVVGSWDIRLVNEARGGEAARYSILVKDSWQEWDAEVPAAQVSPSGSQIRA